ncbi:transporter [Leptolyngbya sp. 'hensonii']|uniref:cadmium resistance transporter n=1 Tax=Leptolyngbya sp. 'hensonii' TaxID=1922337 RepID=UPI00094FFBF0|nr:cadmium resistance transporter [Leptolyngbya sp. 'hensonii']OLP17585.1 transporter [Leptolyngbya sp. 'hensonii']
MGQFFSTLIAGVTAFVATNLDDLVILLLFFARINSTFRPHHIVSGQYLGFTVLVLLSLPGFFGGLLISKPWIGLLGLLPIAIGVHEFLSQEEPKDGEELPQAPPSLSVIGKLLGLFTPQTYQVAAVTIANGGDNIGVYISLFAGLSLPQLGLILGVFGIGVGCWCYLAQQLATHPVMATLLMGYGKKAVPYVLIGLGIYILVENGSYRLFYRP